MVLVQTRCDRAMMTECNGLLESKLVQGTTFRRTDLILCVSWYTSFKLSLRDLVIMMADRGITLTHTPILRWVQHYLPEFEKAMEPLCSSGWRILENGRDIYKRLAAVGSTRIGPWIRPAGPSISS
jgi:transposase-like protein